MDPVNDPNSMLDNIPKVFSGLSSLGVVGIILGAVIGGVILWIVIAANKRKNAKAQKETEKRREEAAAANAGENAQAEDGMAQGENDIEKLLEEGDN